jgi:molybdopterin-guanine dinucleotide biosynthesis protein A
MGMVVREPIIGVLLAGGRSSRFGGGDKCLLRLAGKPLLAWAIDRLKPQVDRLVLNANGDGSRFAAFGLPVVPDYASERIGDFAGPLAGLLAGMMWARAEQPDVRLIATAPTDTPFFPLDLVARLSVATNGEKPAIAASASGVHPVFGVFPVALADRLREDLEAGKRKALDWARAQGAVEVRFERVRVGQSQLDPFFNINRPEDLAEAEALLAAP